jgi:hypothetical protein
MATYQQGTAIQITDTFTVEGVLTDPTNITWTILNPDGTTTIYTELSLEVTHVGTGEWLLNLSPPADPGDYEYDVDATGAVVASRQGGFTVLANVATGVDVPWAVVGPCTPWASAQAVWDCCGQPTTTIGEGSFAEECPVDMTQYAIEASQVLYELSARLFAGQCEKTVRPCVNRWCGFQVLSRGHIVDYGWEMGWNGWGWWGWDAWNQGCGCTPLSRVLLSGYPVREITEVKIDGAVIPADEYRLDERRWLTRMADADGNVQLWPACQRWDLPDTESGTFSVTYRYGQDPPITGIHAAAQLGCELYRACTGGDCVLPSGATRVTRQGVTIERGGFTQWGYKQNTWMTGLSLVDTFLNSYNKAGLMRRPSVWSPSGPKYARPVGQ